MVIEINSVWRFENVSGMRNGIYRVLSHQHELNVIVFYFITLDNKLHRPEGMGTEDFIDEVDTGNIIRSELPISLQTIPSTRNGEVKDRKVRNARYRKIKTLIADPEFLTELILNQRSHSIVEHARKIKTYPQEIRRCLDLYWTFGQNIDALRPAYQLSGSSEKKRIEGDVKLGRPVSYKFDTVNVLNGFNITEQDKFFIKKTYEKYGRKGKSIPFSSLREKMKYDFYQEEMELARKENREERVPNYRCFIYWYKKLIPEVERIRGQSTEREYALARREFNAKTTDHTDVPGSCFELDSTMLDVYVVSKFNPMHVLGRPTLYYVADKESRMITGMHISLEPPSWKIARQALVNTFTNKESYCARYGIKLNEGEWPCFHIPQELSCDRGEFICSDAERLAVPLVGSLRIAPPYRGDLKPIVEKRFDLSNKSIVHELDGSTHGRLKKRGESDPRLESNLTIDQLTKIIITDVLIHNNHRTFDDLRLQSLLPIENDMRYTPLNYWNLHLSNNRHALSIIDESEIRAKLLPIQKVSLRELGVRVNDDLYYECDRSDFKDMKVAARIKAIPLEAVLDQDDSSFIHVRFKKGEAFTKCTLMDFSSRLSETHAADIDLFNRWGKSKKTTKNTDERMIELLNIRSETIAVAKRNKKESAPLSKANRINKMKERKKEEIEKSTVKNNPDTNNGMDSNITSLPISNKRSNVLSLLRRKKET